VRNELELQEEGVAAGQHSARGTQEEEFAATPSLQEEAVENQAPTEATVIVFTMTPEEKTDLVRCAFSKLTSDERAQLEKDVALMTDIVSPTFDALDKMERRHFQLCEGKERLYPSQIPRGAALVLECVIHLWAGVNDCIEIWTGGPRKGRPKDASCRQIERMLSDPIAFVMGLRSFKCEMDHRNVPQANIDAAKNIIKEMGDEFSADVMRKYEKWAPLATFLVEWVRAMVSYYDAGRTIDARLGLVSVDEAAKAEAQMAGAADEAQAAVESAIEQPREPEVLAHDVDRPMEAPSRPYHRMPLEAAQVRLAVAQWMRCEMPGAVTDANVVLEVARHVVGLQLKAEMVRSEPAFRSCEDAAAALNQISQRDIQNVARLLRPPDIFQRIMDTILILLMKPLIEVEIIEVNRAHKITAHKASYTIARTECLQKANFLEQLRGFPKDSMNGETVELLQPYLEFPGFNVEWASKALGSLSYLVRWVEVMAIYPQIAAAQRRVETLRGIERALANE